jgi:hypothetical protein
MLRTPVNPLTRRPGRELRSKLNTGVPSITVDSNRNSTCARFASLRRISMRNRSLVRGNHVNALGKRRSDVGDRRVAVYRVQGRDLDCDIGTCAIQEFNSARRRFPKRRHCRQPLPGRMPCRGALCGFPQSEIALAAVPAIAKKLGLRLRTRSVRLSKVELVNCLAQLRLLGQTSLLSSRVPGT